MEFTPYPLSNLGTCGEQFDRGVGEQGGDSGEEFSLSATLAEFPLTSDEKVQVGKGGTPLDWDLIA